MERILIDSQAKGYALQYEKSFRALKHDVPGDLRGWKAVLSALNTYNHLTPVELDQYQKYLEEQLGMEAIVLPSTSPANAAYSLVILIDAWRIIKGN